MAKPAKLWFTMQELAILLDVTPKTIGRYLTKCGIPTEMVGGERCVWLSELYARKPQLFDSQQVARNLANEDD